MPDLKIYTILDLSNWLIHNHAAEGLSEKIIAPARAWAIIHNPYVKDEDAVVAAIFVNNEVAAYTTAFPELINGERYWWFSALWCDPKYRGHGYGIIVIGSLAEIYGIEHSLDRWGAPDTVEIFTYLGQRTSYSKRYILGSKIDHRTYKGKLIYLGRYSQKLLHKLIERPAKKVAYELCYITHVDDTTYSFIQQNKKDDYFLRSKEMLNWILHYSFTISTPLIEHTRPSSSFSPSETINSQIYAIQVWDNDTIIGFYMMKLTSKCLHMLYLYYLEEEKSKVFASVRDHIKRMPTSQFLTDNEELQKYIRQQIYFPKFRVINISFSHPESFAEPTNKTVQYGDGDSFTQ